METNLRHSCFFRDCTLCRMFFANTVIKICHSWTVNRNTNKMLLWKTAYILFTNHSCFLSVLSSWRLKLNVTVYIERKMKYLIKLVLILDVSEPLNNFNYDLIVRLSTKLTYRIVWQILLIIYLLIVATSLFPHGFVLYSNCPSRVLSE